MASSCAKLSTSCRVIAPHSAIGLVGHSFAVSRSRQTAPIRLTHGNNAILPCVSRADTGVSSRGRPADNFYVDSLYQPHFGTAVKDFLNARGSSTGSSRYARCAKNMILSEAIFAIQNDVFVVPCGKGKEKP